MNSPSLVLVALRAERHARALEAEAKVTGTPAAVQRAADARALSIELCQFIGPEVADMLEAVRAERARRAEAVRMSGEDMMPLAPEPQP